MHPSIFVILTLAIAACGIQPSGAKKHLPEEVCVTGSDLHSSLQLRANDQLENSIRRIFGDELSFQVANSLADLRQEDGTSPQKIEKLFKLATDLAVIAGRDPVFLKSLKIDSLLDSLAMKIFNRPLPPVLRARYQEILSQETTLEASVQTLLAVMLQSPYFLYNVQFLDKATSQLDSYTVAQNISFPLTGYPPDKRLLKLADQKQLQDPDLRNKEILRLLSSNIGRARLKKFFRDWVGYKSSSQEMYPDLGLSAGIELDEFFNKIIFTDGSFEELFTASFNSAEDRYGLIESAGFLLAEEESSALVDRGVKVLNQLLCFDLSIPEMMDEANMVARNIEGVSNRERWEALTSSPDCKGCHGMINAFGSTLENYDAIGRWREEETVFGDDGSFLATYPINAENIISLGGKETTLRSSRDLSKYLADHPRTKVCFSRELSRFALGQSTDDSHRCLIKQLSKDLKTKSVHDSVVNFFLAVSDPGSATK